MGAITLDQRDATELADLLQFLLDQLYRAADARPPQLWPLLEAESPYHLDDLRDDVNRMIHILTAPQKTP